MCRLVRRIAGPDLFSEVAVLRLDDVIGRLAAQPRVAWAAQLAARHGFHRNLLGVCVAAARALTGSGGRVHALMTMPRRQM
jgi:hypothetical protein